MPALNSSSCSALPAIADRRDVIPAVVEAVGGKVEHFGMPVDPGNLMLIASADGTPVLGAPGCARSRRRAVSTGCWRVLLCGLPVSRHDIAWRYGRRWVADGNRHPAAAARGLDAPARPAYHATIVLAAGKSTRCPVVWTKLLSDVWR